MTRKTILTRATPRDGPSALLRSGLPVDVTSLGCVRCRFAQHLHFWGHGGASGDASNTPSRGANLPDRQFRLRLSASTRHGDGQPSLPASDGMCTTRPFGLDAVAPVVGQGPVLGRGTARRERSRAPAGTLRGGRGGRSFSPRPRRVFRFLRRDDADDQVLAAFLALDAPRAQGRPGSWRYGIRHCSGVHSRPQPGAPNNFDCF